MESKISLQIAITIISSFLRIRVELKFEFCCISVLEFNLLKYRTVDLKVGLTSIQIIIKITRFTNLFPVMLNSNPLVHFQPQATYLSGSKRFEVDFSL